MAAALPRTSSIVVCLLGLLFALQWRAWADDLAVPAQLQVDLSAKVVEYAQEPYVISGPVVRIAIIVKPHQTESMRVGNDIKAAFNRLGPIARRSHEETILQWSSAEALATDSARRHLSIIYLTPGLDADVAALARALQGSGVLTIAAVDSFVRQGAVLGFDVVSGRPKMLFNVVQAKKQNVMFRSAALRLMRIVE